VSPLDCAEGKYAATRRHWIKQSAGQHRVRQSVLGSGSAAM